ncbi:MAG: hypothetical protein IJQ62_13445 [Clostridia bacterium]|nr:hypothetical protein [Clostridia bacterium]
MMRRTVRLSPAGTQLVRDALGSKLMLGFVIVSGTYYALLLVSSVLDGSALSLSLISILCQGFVTAESMILYQRKESRNLKHLSIFCLIAMIVMLAFCVFLGAVVLTLNREYGAKTEEIMQLWAEADIANGMPAMIATVAAAGVSGIEMLFLWKALGMCAGLMERKDTQMRNWFLPAAVFSGLYALLLLAIDVIWPSGIFSVFTSLVCVVRDGLLTVLLAQTALQYTAKIR